MGGGNTANAPDEGMTSGTNHLSQLKRKAKTKVKEFIHTAQMKKEHVEREIFWGRTSRREALARVQVRALERTRQIGA